MKNQLIAVDDRLKCEKLNFKFVQNQKWNTYEIVKKLLR